MKVLILGLLLSFLGHAALAEKFSQEDLTVEQAQLQALNYADELFSNLLDSDSHISLGPVNDNGQQFEFIATLTNADKVCSVSLSVSKETGLAFSDQGFDEERDCQKLE